MPQFEDVVEEYFSPNRGEGFGDPSQAGSGSESSLKMLSSPSSAPVDLAVKRTGQQKLFQCPYHECRKDFNKKYNMQMHLRQHTGEKPYVCTFQGCNLKFKWRSSLRNHQRYHYADEKQPTTKSGSERGRKSRSTSKVLSAPPSRQMSCMEQNTPKLEMTLTSHRSAPIDSLKFEDELLDCTPLPTSGMSDMLPF